MPIQLFDKKEVLPTEENFKKVLKGSYPAYRELIKFIEENFGTLKPDWKFYSPKYGWTLKTFLKKRNLFFISPQDGKFAIAFVFGSKAVEKVNESNIDDHIKEELNNARKYAEGQGVRLEVEDDSILEDLKKLVEIKINY